MNWFTVACEAFARLHTLRMLYSWNSPSLPSPAPNCLWHVRLVHQCCNLYGEAQPATTSVKLLLVACDDYGSRSLSPQNNGGFAGEREREKKKNEKWEIEDIAENGQVCGSIGVPILIHAQYAAASWLGKTMVDTRDAHCRELSTQEMEGEAAALAGSAHWYYSLTSSMLELLELSNVNWTTLDCCSSKEYINRLRHLKPGAFGPPI